MTTKQEVLDSIRTYLAANEGAAAADIKQDIVAILPADTQANMPSRSTHELTEAITKLKISQATKMPKYTKGENFSRYCERFIQYVYISDIKDANLHIYFLQNLDDATYTTLQGVNLTPEQKRDAKAFCDIYKQTVYGDQAIYLKTEVMDCKQKADESIADFAYRLRDKGSIAYGNTQEASDNCLMAFLRGVKDPQLRRKLNEASITSFKEAVKHAKRLEHIDNMLNEQEVDRALNNKMKH